MAGSSSVHTCIWKYWSTLIWSILIWIWVKKFFELWVECGGKDILGFNSNLFFYWLAQFIFPVNSNITWRLLLPESTFKVMSSSNLTLVCKVWSRGISHPFFKNFPHVCYQFTDSECLNRLKKQNEVKGIITITVNIYFLLGLRVITEWWYLLLRSIT